MNASPLLAVSRPLWPVLAVALLASGCGTLGERDSAGREGLDPDLVVPPDLVMPQSDPAFRIPEVGGAPVASGGAHAGEGTQQVLPEPEGMTLHREGSVRWLEVERISPEALWRHLEAFFESEGIELERNDPRRGILETGWIESGADAPVEGGLRRLFSGIFGNTYDAGVRHRYRLRVEPAGNGAAVFVSHRGLVEVAEREDLVRWAVAPPDPEAEARMLVRIMTHLGKDPERAAEALAEAAEGAPEVVLRDGEKGPELWVRGDYDPVWRRMGVVLDRASLLVQDYDREAGRYEVIYRPAEQERPSGGFLSRLLGNGDGPALEEGARYRLHLQRRDDGVVVSARDGDGGALSADMSRALLERVRDVFRGEGVEAQTR
ncbi:Beta-barrel assembly machine subunit BamC [Ectothiorhodospira mobilis]|uniref:Beta-barrel assembly machine subunit BamC n=1 Tax=Ectothiorhodospira mobilis TaxID=195064 RepID=A0A1I4SL72_ECTMO|nr:outer membrane protein assembly factor BamC [Ectothiorhodospira mobilis]SFM65100.1 Beta-barrel assembly machine subunit BamC [Ectothiorhodospira mobilis]